MVAFPAAVLCLCLSSTLVASLPSSPQHPIAIARKPTALGRVERAVRSKERTLLKYQRNATLAKRQSTTLANPESDEFYVASVVVGNGQSVLVTLDTGSSDTWFRGRVCTSDDQACQTGHRGLSTSDASLALVGNTFSIEYGKGSVSGPIYSGKVGLAGYTGSFQFGITSKESGMFDGETSGLIGLAFNPLSTINSATGGNANFIDSLRLAKSSNLFAFYLSNAAQGDLGEMTIGYVDSSKYTGKFVYVPLNSQTFWQFAWTGATYQVGTSSGSAVGTVHNAIADTGSSLIVLDTVPANNINKAIGASAYSAAIDGYPIACSLASSGAPVTLSFGGSSFVIPASTYVYSNGDGTCISGFARGAHGYQVILGDVFIRNYVTVFDKGNLRLGFAKAKHP
ncbi:hypothetical protein HDV03_001765 [Kappamyces sp. JEL0829]|nr:hypothetical protein HDV03_001765 [Kappamyces sp. JEL0829]